MAKKDAAIFALAMLLSAIPATLEAQDAKTVLSNAAKAMGAENLKTIQYTGSGSNAGIGQNRNPSVAWPVVRVKSYTREIDFNAPASHAQIVRVQPAGEQTQNQFILPNAGWDTQFDIWISPYGFLKAGMANDSTVKSETLDGEKYTVVSFTIQNKYKVNGYINAQNLVERVQTWLDNDVLGDMLVDAIYKDYKDFAGLKFPTMIIQKQGGYPVLILIVSDVKPNAAVNIQAPQQTQGQPARQLHKPLRSRRRKSRTECTT